MQNEIFILTIMSKIQINKVTIILKSKHLGQD